MSFTDLVKMRTLLVGSFLHSVRRVDRVYDSAFSQGVIASRDESTTYIPLSTNLIFQFQNSERFIGSVGPNISSHFPAPFHLLRRPVGTTQKEAQMIRTIDQQ